MNRQHFHFVGINGIGMSAIAKILYKQGHTISGCDLACDLMNVQELVKNGCRISSQHNSDICHDTSISTVVYSSDVDYQSKELVNARNKGIATLQRAAVLAQIIHTKKYSIGIAGSHGKTTTTSMISHIFMHAQYDPTIIVGGIMNNIHNNAHYGSSEYMITEVDESDRSHLLLHVNTAVITNIDFEHVNTYKNIEEIIETFRIFLTQVSPSGHAIICLDDENIRTMYHTYRFNTDIIDYTYGINRQARIRPINIHLNPTNSTFDIDGYQDLSDITINTPGIHNVLNATAAIATALSFNIPQQTIKEALQSFQGVDRRFTFKGMMAHPTVEIYDDYGHHPTEIYHALITARKKTKHNLIVIFQPQRYTRTFHLWNDFVQVFANSGIDHLIITDIYTAHETPIENITAEKLVLAIKSKNPSCHVSYIPFDHDLTAIKNNVLSIISDNDLILLLGAGKVNKLADKLL